jgi:deoxyribodipyrimidine photo-lyase
MEPSRRCLFLFRRDLRLHDNTGLNHALGSSAEVVAAFVLDPRQCKGHPYFSARGFRFLHESLRELDGELRARGGRLYVFEGDPAAVVNQLVVGGHVQSVAVNRDYTPFSLARDGAMLAICRRFGATFSSFDDALLHAPEEVATVASGPYQVFSAFHRAARNRPLRQPAALAAGRFATLDLPGEITLPPLSPAADASHPGGRANGLARLARATGLADYETTRDLPALEGTSLLSPHLKFGTVSVREVHRTLAEALGPDHGLLRELHWRDFFTHVAWHAPKVFGTPYRDEFARVPWSHSAELLAAWSTGTTGFPLVDAGMRELAATGFMHNRVRMATASFLVKDLHVDWREGERVFARHLVDYDPAVNNGAWQWVAGTGCDAQPWFRVFNPWLQAKRFDPDALYIKRWVPELAGLTAAQIHALDTCGVPADVDYPPPMVDHAVQAARAKELYTMAR